MKENLKKHKINPFFITEIQPCGGIKAEENKLIKGDGYETCINIYKTPTEVDVFWLKKIMNLKNAIVTLDIATENKKKAKDKIKMAMKEQASRFSSTNDSEQQTLAKKEYNNMKALQELVLEAGEIIKLFKIRIYLADKEKSKLEERVKDIIEDLESRNYAGAINLNELEMDYQSLFSSYKVQQKFFNKRNWQGAPSLSLGASLPFHYVCLDDPYGLFIGTSSTGGSIIFDLFHKTEDRLSYNGVLIGKPGSGKSSALKKLLLNNNILGNTVRVIDVTGEFSELVKELGGKEISLDGTGMIINPLQIYSTIMDENTNEVLEDKCYSCHISKLTMIYRVLSPTASEEEIREYGLLLNKFYREFGIDRKKATTYKVEEYPIFSDFLKFVKEELYEDIEKEIVKKNLLKSREERLDKIILTIEDLVLNYGDLFDGHSSIEDVTKEDLISYNLKNISQYDDKIFLCQIFSVLTSIWGQSLVQGRREKEQFDSGEKSIEDVKKFLIILDEAHICINPRQIDTVRYINRIQRENRKYFGGLLIANHSINDYVPESIDGKELSELKKIFTMSQYKLLMKQGIEEEKNLKKIFGASISDKQVSEVSKFKKGDTIMFIDGMPNIRMKFELTKEELKLFKGGA
ncbi:hypothetical protein QJR26_04500 [Clostridium baratii]